MLEKTDKAKELAKQVSIAILECLQEHSKGITNIDCVMGVLLGATAMVSTVHRSMDEDQYEEMTAAVLALWADTYRNDLSGNPTLKSNGHGR